MCTIYDDHGNYGHPDHIQVYRVGKRAAELAGVAEVYEATMNRDRLLGDAKRTALTLAANYAAPEPGRVLVSGSAGAAALAAGQVVVEGPVVCVAVVVDLDRVGTA